LVEVIIYLQNINTKKRKTNNIKKTIIRSNKAVIFDLGVFGACMLLWRECAKNFRHIYVRGHPMM
jgi:hypothetical protein